eukprot:Selendium_serpulae@DN5951_c0_g1_i1.p2
MLCHFVVPLFRLWLSASADRREEIICAYRSLERSKDRENKDGRHLASPLSPQHDSKKRIRKEKATTPLPVSPVSAPPSPIVAKSSPKADKRRPSVEEGTTGSQKPQSPEASSTHRGGARRGKQPHSPK